LAQAFNRTLWLPNIPGFVMKLIFGKKSEILLQGSRVSADKIQAKGYKFQFPNLPGALQNLFFGKNL
jgi:NAD dependent epimerase/dehydratase family enzyme